MTRLFVQCERLEWRQLIPSVDDFAQTGNDTLNFLDSSRHETIRYVKYLSLNVPLHQQQPIAVAPDFFVLQLLFTIPCLLEKLARALLM